MSGGPEVNMSCQNARSLVASYLDGELSEEQAAQLRTHLLACVACRETAKEGKTIRRWFAASADQVDVPPGFAARVARRAFAGDPGVLVAHGSSARQAQREPAGALLPFVLKLSAVAAGLLFVFSIGIRMTSLPSGSGMDAQEKQPWELQESPDDEPLEAEIPDTVDRTGDEE